MFHCIKEMLRTCVFALFWSLSNIHFLCFVFVLQLTHRRGHCNCVGRHHAIIFVVCASLPCFLCVFQSLLVFFSFRLVYFFFPSFFWAVLERMNESLKYIYFHFRRARHVISLCCCCCFRRWWWCVYVYVSFPYPVETAAVVCDDSLFLREIKLFKSKAKLSFSSECPFFDLF